MTICPELVRGLAATQVYVGSSPIVVSSWAIKCPTISTIIDLKIKGETVMKKRHWIMSCLFLGVLSVALIACAATSKSSSTGQFVDDSVITTTIKSKLAEDDFLKSFKISVETYKGTVQLSGFVDTKKAVDRANEIVRSVEGVKSIKNDLIIK